MKIFGLFALTSLAEDPIDPKSGAVCDEIFASSFNQNRGTGFIQNDAMENNRGYTTSDSCRWTIMSLSGQKLMIRFDRFDTEDSKKCDDNPKNDSKGANSVFQMTFRDSENNWTREKFCHTLGADRQAHRNQNHRSIIRNFEGNNPKTFKHKMGENLMGWTELDSWSIIFDFAVGTGANPNGFYKGFKIEYGLESTLAVADLKQEILDFIENYSL